jgi:pyridoxine 4-dehydrogenase
MELVGEVEKLAEKKGCKVSQVAIAWVKAQSSRPGMPTFIPIPGATTVARVEENDELVDLTTTELQELSVAMQKCLVKGDRYPDAVNVFNFGDSPEE